MHADPQHSLAQLSVRGAGLLPALARDLDVSLPAVSQLVTAFSLTYAVGAPVMAVLTAGLERRGLLALAMAGFSLANLFAALAPNYAGLLAARLLLALSVASFHAGGEWVCRRSGRAGAARPRSVHGNRWADLSNRNQIHHH